MEEDEIDLVDYFRVIWKQKILIIVGILVCIVVGAVMSLWLPVTYRAEALIKIGQKANAVNTFPPTYSPIDTAENLKRSIPVMYELNEHSLEYHLKTEKVNDESMIRISMEGVDMRRAKEILEEIVNRLIDDHYETAEDFLRGYKTHYKKYVMDLNAEIEVIQSVDSYIEKQMEKIETEKADPIAMAMLMYIKKMDSRTWPKNNKRKLLKEESSFESLGKDEKYKTRVIGGTRAGKASITVNKKLFVLSAGGVGLMFSLFLVLIKEWVRERVEKRKKSV
jgi:LPS O-antigen subunit length determinant protein (WzzB/FepE family)